MTSWKNKADISDNSIHVPDNYKPIELFETLSSATPVDEPLSEKNPIGQTSPSVKEGFEIFDDNYFKNCYNWIDQLGNKLNSLGVVKGWRKFIKYITCPIVSFDALLLNYLFRIIGYVYFVYCESRGGLESFVESMDSLEFYDEDEYPNPLNSPGPPEPSEPPLLTESSSSSSEYPSTKSNEKAYANSSNTGFNQLTIFQQYSVNAILSNHDWIIQNNSVNDPTTQNIINVIVQTYALNYSNYFNNQSGGDKTDMLIKFDIFFNAQLEDKEIISKIKNQAILLNPSIEEDTNIEEVDVNPIDDDIDDGSCRSKVKRRRKEFLKYAKIIRDEIYTILQIPIMIYVTYNIFFIFFFLNEYEHPEILFPNIHLEYWLGTFSSLSESIKKEYAYISKSGYTGVEKIHELDVDTLPPPKEEFTALTQESVDKMAGGTKKTMTDTVMSMFYHIDTRTFFHSTLDFIFGITWKPFINIHTIFENYRSSFASKYVEYKLKNYVWALFYVVLMIVLFFFNYIYSQLRYIGTIIEAVISGRTSKIYDIVVNSGFYTTIYAYCTNIIIFGFVAYLIKTFTLDMYSVLKITSTFPFSLLFFIAQKIFTILFRLICVIVLMSPAVMLCVVYCIVLFMGAMRYCSVRGTAWASMRAINRVVYTSIFQNSFKPSSEDSENPYNWDPDSETDPPKSSMDPLHIIYEMLIMVPKYQFVYMMEFPILMILITGIYTYQSKIRDRNLQTILIILNTLAICFLLFFMWVKGFKPNHNGFSLLGSWKKIEIFRVLSGFINFFKINQNDTKSTLEEIYGKD